MGHARAISRLRLKESLALLGVMSIVGCATAGGVSAEQLFLTAQNSSCSNPLIIQHSLKGENKKALSSDLIPEAERVGRVLAMGYDLAPVANNKNCGQDNIYTYRVTPKVVQSAEALYETLHVRHMTRAAIKADPNVICKPNYTQVYQPPIKLGGTGRMIQVTNGEKCTTLTSRVIKTDAIVESKLERHQNLCSQVGTPLCSDYKSDSAPFYWVSLNSLK